MSDIKEKAVSTYCKAIPQTGTIDVYRVLLAFNVTDPCLQHAIKKLLCPGQRKAGKTLDQDVREAIYSLQRWEEMRQEEGPKKTVSSVPAERALDVCSCSHLREDHAGGAGRCFWCANCAKFFPHPQPRLAETG